MDSLLATLKAAGEETRLRLLALCALGDLTVSDLTRILGQSQPRISRHLKVLCDTGLLERFREGSWVFYRLAAERGTEGARVARHILALLPEGDSRLLADRARLAAVREERDATAQAYFRDNAAQWDAIRSLHIEEEAVEQALVAALARHQSGGTDLLVDVGTGTGRLLELLGPRCRSALGIDQSREMLALARMTLEQAGLRHCQVRLGDMYALPVADGAAELVTIHQVLHFAEHPAAVLAEAARALKPGGLLAVVDFAPHDLETLRQDHNHRRLGFAPEEVTGWGEATGLSPLETLSLPGRPLTVLIWLAHKPAAVQETRP